MYRPTHITGIFGALILMLCIQDSHAGTATWDLNPGSGDWNTADNWMPATVPNRSADIATFDLSNTTNVSISENTQVNSVIFTAGATNPYTISVGPGLTFTLSGPGIINNSGLTQHFSILTDGAGNFGTLVFSGNATAGNNIAADNSGEIEFLNHSSAVSLSVFNEFGAMRFFNNSSVADATILAIGSSVLFANHSSAGSAFIGVDDRSLLQFADRSTAGNATMGGAGFIGFFDSSTASSATIQSDGGYLVFDGSSRGGAAQIELLFHPALEQGAVLDISDHDAPGVTIGSLEGDETALVFLGANNLTVGSNNLSTTFSGVIQDGGQNGGAGGSLTKIEPGTLTLTGANTYTGDTNVNRGVLQVDGSITSNAFVNQRGTLAGIGTIQGDVTNAGGTVSPGDPVGTLTVTGNYTQQASGTLLINIAGVGTDQFSLLNVLGTAELDGRLNPVLLDGFIPAVGDSFTFLNYASVSGSLFTPDRNIDGLMEHWLVTYFPDHAVLSVAAGNVSLPDRGSAVLLFACALSSVALFYRTVYRYSPRN
jgi:autotransporter-associated beta strand protein